MPVNLFFKDIPNILERLRLFFVGNVAEVASNDSPDEEDRRYYPCKIKFFVEKSWMGDKSEITVISDNGNHPCPGVRFEAGKRYLVYAFGKNLSVPSCIGNRSKQIELEDDISKKEFAELSSFWFRLKASLWRF